jgi:hypothetical protein
MPITLDRRPKGRYPFGVFHISMGSTLCTEFELKSDWTVGDLPSSVLVSVSLELSDGLSQSCLSSNSASVIASVGVG